MNEKNEKKERGSCFNEIFFFFFFPEENQRHLN